MESPVGADPLEPTRGVFVRSRLTYTLCYCEENIYCMVRDHVDSLDRKHYVVVFISNEEKFTPLFHQKAGNHPKIPVCWDYHVILINKPTAENLSSMVYDFDTTLDPFGLPFETYFSKTLYGDESLWLESDPEVDRETVFSIIDKHPRFFKLIPAEEYLRLFASTRAHMMKESSIHKTEQEGGNLDVKELAEAGWWEDSWLAKPPSYPPIRTKESDDTLKRFLDFSHQGEDEYGKIVDERGFWQEFTSTSDSDASLAEAKQIISNAGELFVVSFEV